MNLLVVWHAASIGCYREVVPEQLHLLSELGLSHVLCTHVGPDLPFVQASASAAGVQLMVEYSDSDPLKCEVPAMLLVERLARWNDGAVLYLHTKGVTRPTSALHQRWRRLMHAHTLRPWRDHLRRLEQGATCCGFDWINQKDHPHGHFSGNFWIARCDYLRTLPQYSEFHAKEGYSRFSAEQWVGRGPDCQPHSEGVTDVCWGHLGQVPLKGEPALVPFCYVHSIPFTRRGP